KSLKDTASALILNTQSISPAACFRLKARTEFGPSTNSISPNLNAGYFFRIASISRENFKTELGSASCVDTASGLCSGESGSQGVPLVKPKFAALAFHGIGVRQPSRPLCCG